MLYNMLRDKDAQVVTNVINALNEILADEVGWGTRVYSLALVSSVIADISIHYCVSATRRARWLSTPASSVTC